MGTKIAFARKLRRRQTPEEMILWDILRNRQFHHLKFRRQARVGPYVADFLSFQHRLIVELDGPIHKDQKEYDQNRDLYLQERKFRVLRIPNHVLTATPERALETIYDAVQGKLSAVRL